MPVYPANTTLPLSIANGGTGASTAGAAATALGLGTSDTPTFAAVNLGDTNLSDYKEGTFTPTVTLVGGSGNTVPVYGVNSGVYTRIGNQVFNDVELNNDGGSEGAGTGQMTIALPIVAESSGRTSIISCGYADNTINYNLVGTIASGASVIKLYYWTTSTSLVEFTGADQNAVGRSLRLHFTYRV